MTTPAQFDALYADARDRLLAETYALTGDLPASRTAVRDSFAAAWHHWRAVARTADPEDWIRPHAHRRALHRHSARPWHRERGVDEEAARTLEALSELTGTQRRVLVLSHVAPLSLDGIARHVAIPRHRAEDELQQATAQFALHREVPSTSVRSHLDHLRSVTEQVRWPRATIVRRQGAARRRTHTVLGTAAAVVALVASGAVVSAGNARSTELAREQTAPLAATLRPAAAPAPPELSPDFLLTEAQVERFGPRLRWRERETDANLDGDGLLVPCQAERFADPEGLAALTREFVGTPRGGGRGRRAVQARTVELMELSRTTRAARHAFRETAGWYAGCAAPRVQLLSTHDVARVGDDARLFVLRSWGRDPDALAVGVARTGRTTLTQAVELETGQVDVPTATRALAAAVNRLCGSKAAGSCAGPPRSRQVAPYPTGEARGMLAAVDLPPVTHAEGPWVGTDPTRPRVNAAATRCDNTSFTGKSLRHDRTRTFLFPANERADSFGLTQTVARTRDAAQAHAFVAEVRRRIRTCGEANLGTDVETLLTQSTAERDLTVWDLAIEISDARTVDFWMAVMRDGTAVSQVGFVSESDLTMARDDFRAVAVRALERLSALPGGGRGKGRGQD